MQRIARVIPRFVLSLLIITVLSAPALPADAAVWCQCVDYIKYRYQLSGSVGGNGGAKDMGPYLEARGFRRINLPKVGAVVIFQPAFGDVNSTYGHVGVIITVQDLGSYWKLTVKGANQSGAQSTEYNCTNVTNIGFKQYSKSWGTDKVAYYTRNLALGRPTYATSIESSFYPAYKANDGHNGTRWSSRITSIGREYWKVDLQTLRSFDRIMIRWETAYARTYYIGWSTDGYSFTGKWFTASYAATRMYVFSSPATARYILVLMQDRAPWMGNFSFWELSVFANGAAMIGY